MRDDTPTAESRIAGECLAGRVRVLDRVVTGIYDDALRPHKVRVTQLSVLVAIAARTEARAADVCRRLRLDKSTLSRDLDRLLDRGWVRATPGARRVQELEVTAAGRALIKKVVPAWEAAQARVRDILGAALTKGIAEAVERLRAADFDRR
jgi:DNA-binding MarR family transcriptional regulator